MKFQGIIDKIAITLDNKWLLVTFKFPYRTALQERAQTLTEKDLDIEFDKHTESKTDQQRKYYWALVKELRKKLRNGITEDEIHKNILRRNGISEWLALPPDKMYVAKEYYKIVDDMGPTVLTTPSGKEIEARQLRCWKGLRHYTVDEACLLIDSLVDECREQGIPTDTPDEIKRMKEQWGVNIG